MSWSANAIDERTSLEALAHIVCAALLDAGIDAVLTGGAVVSFYTDNRYQSYDLDFIADVSLKDVEPLLGTLGFTKKTGRHSGHPKSRYEVEFPGREVILGNTKVNGFRTVETTLGRLQLLTPTQAVMDRLAAFYAWGDRMSLKQAVLIAQCQPVRL